AFEVYDNLRKSVQDVGDTTLAACNTMLGEYAQAYPELANDLQAAMNGLLPEGGEHSLRTYELGSNAATRNSSGAV
ncbi:transketolase, partial [Bacillus mycoides]|nr:transketolase [Bacillus mycoides]